MFFVDEIHRLPRALEETFYPAMEDGELPIVIGSGRRREGAVGTAAGFHADRRDDAERAAVDAACAIASGFSTASSTTAAEDLARIVRRSARLLGVEIEDDGAIAVAARSRGTPRVANRLLRRVRDYAEVHGDGVVTAPIAGAALDLLEVDHLGLDRLDREILRAICHKFDGGPVGLSTLAAAVGEEQDTIEDVYEPYLLQHGLIERTPRGRAATRRAFAHLGSSRRRRRRRTRLLL